MTDSSKLNLSRLLRRAEPPSRFLVLVELVPGPGHETASLEKFLRDYSEKKDSVPKSFLLAGITLPQSPNGIFSLSPADIFSALEKKGLWSDLDVIPHATAKDHNTEAIKSYLIGLRTLGLESILALTGDKPASGKGVFEVDSAGLIELIKDLNFESLQRAAPGDYERAHQFSVLAAVSPFKYTEASLMQQVIKMRKKLAAGADGFITQMGWDWRKSADFFRYLAEEGIHVPIFGNVYVLTTATPAPRLMAEGKLPGCLVTRELFAQLTRETPEEHIERAGQQVAMYRDLGAAGVDIGGIADFKTLVAVLKLAEEIGGDWTRHRENLNFGIKTLPDGRPPFYLYDEGGRRREPSRPKATFRKRTFDGLHRFLLTPGQGLYPALRTILKSSSSLRREKGVPYRLFLSAEKSLKTLLFECEECGDCFLVENFGYCTLGECAKGMPNPPCGDATPDGKCPHDPERRCVGELIYEAAASEGKRGLLRLRDLINPRRDPALESTASLLNYLFEKDHTKKIPIIQIGESLHASIPKTGPAMKELLDKGPAAYETSSGALAYLLSLIQAQVKHGAAYIDVNVDAFGQEDLPARIRIMRDYVRLIRKHGRGVPVCVDSGSPEVLVAGLEEWYKHAPPSVRPPLLNSVKTYTMAEILPLRSRYPFKFIGLLVDIASTGSEGSYYGIDELCAMARMIFRAAIGTYGFKPEDIFFDSTVFPLVIDMPMAADTPGYTYRTFETMRRIKADREMKGVHLSLGITNAVRDLPGRRTGVTRAYLAKAMEYGLDAAIVNVMHDYGKRPPAAELLDFVGVFARQDGSAAAAQRAVGAMMEFCRANRKAKPAAR
jgi:5,10-methylenetetrahydrofolate reductase